MTEDDQLMLQLQGGEAAAFNALVERHQAALFGFFVRQTRDRQVAEDLTQETLLKVYNQSWDYLPRGIFRGWLFRIARNLLIDSVRRRSHDALLHARRDISNDDGERWLDQIPGIAIDAEQRADQAEISDLVKSILATCPEEQRLTFHLFVFENLSLPEVADALNTNLSTTKSRLRLAREKLKLALAEKGIHDPFGRVEHAGENA